MAKQEINKLYIDIKIEGLDYFRQNNRVDVKSVLVVDKFGNEILQADNLDALYQYIKDNIRTRTDFIFWGDNGLHSLLPYLNNRIGISKLSFRLIKNTILSISWKREYQQNKIRKKYTIKFIDASRAYPTPLIDRGMDSEKLLFALRSHMAGIPKEYLSSNLATTLSGQAWSKWKESTYHGRYIHTWLQTEKLDENGEIVYDSKGKPIMVPMEDLWTETKKAFNGGFLYVNPEYQMRVIDEVLYKWDMNSMYAHIMREFSHPVGEPTYEIPEGFEDAFSYRMYRVDIKHAKTEGIPFITVDESINAGAVYEDLNGNKEGDIRTNKVRPKEMSNVTVNMNNYTYEYFKEQYEGEWEKTFIYACEEEFDIFEEYLTEVLNLKMVFDGNKALRNHFKQMIVAPYGKAAQKKFTLKACIDDIENVDILYSREGNPHYNGQDVFINDGLAYFQEDADESNTISYIPLAESIAAKAELFMLKILNKNPNAVVYVDTDGFITTEKYGWGFEIDDVEIGKFKFEGKWDKSVIRGYKHYLLRSYDGREEWKAAGVDKNKVKIGKIKLEEYAQPEVNLGHAQYNRVIVNGGLLEYMAEIKLTDLRETRKENNVEEKVELGFKDDEEFNKMWEKIWG